MRLYLDANPIVFTVEGPSHLREAVAAWLDRAEAAVNGVILTSRLSRIECLTQSLREKDSAKFEAMDRFFTGGGIEILSLDDGLVDIATDLQRDVSLRNHRRPSCRHGHSRQGRCIPHTRWWDRSVRHDTNRSHRTD